MTQLIREIAFDTETTGLNPNDGDRVIEIGAVEMINHIPTGKTFHTRINPRRSVSEATIRITGLTDEHLKDAPFFEEEHVVGAFMEFIGDATLVAHNAGFDRGFLNMELALCGRDPVPDDRWLDTAALARRKYPGAPASLDALCKRFDISARYMVPCSTASCLPASIWNCWAAGPGRSLSMRRKPNWRPADAAQPANARRSCHP